MLVAVRLCCFQYRLVVEAAVDAPGIAIENAVVALNASGLSFQRLFSILAQSARATVLGRLAFRGVIKTATKTATVCQK